MREMKNSGIEWAAEIPVHWQVMPTKYLMQKIKKIQPVYSGEEILSLTMNGVVVRDLDAGGKMPASFDGYQIVEPNNLLMCLFDIDVTPRCIGLIKNHGLTSPAYSQFKLYDLANERYYYYYFLMLDFSKELLHLAKNLRHSLTEEQLGYVNHIVPPLKEQVAIANFLDAKCSEIDALTADIQSQIETLEQYKRSVITEAVTKGLDPNAEMKNSGIEWVGEIPTDWNVVPIRVLFDEVTRKNRLGEEKTALKFTYGTIIPKTNFDADDDSYVANTILSYTLVTPGVIMINCLNLNYDFISQRIGLVKDKGAITSAYLAIKPNNQVAPEFANYQLKSWDFLKAFHNMGSGVRKTLDFSELKKKYFVLPDLSTQHKIANFLNAKCSEIDACIATKKEQLQTLDSYKKSLIYEYVTGKKEVLQYVG